MPVLHDYKCEEGHITEKFQDWQERVAECSVCGKPARRIVSGSNLDIWKPQHWEELGDDCPLIESKAHLARICEERGFYSRCLMESYRNHGRRREI